MNRTQTPPDTAHSNRRGFVQAAALGAVALLAPSAPGLAEPAPSEEPADALTEIVRRRHGEHLSDDQLKQVRASIQRSLRSADTLRRFPLTNGDEPAFGFSADVP